MGQQFEFSDELAYTEKKLKELNLQEENNKEQITVIEV